MKAAKIIAIIIVICIGGYQLYGIFHAIFAIPRPPATSCRGSVIGSLRRYLQYEHPAGERAPADLVALGIYGDHMDRCAPTTEAKSGKFLVIYNPGYKKAEKDWILIVLGRTWFGLKELEPLVLWSDLTQSGEPHALSLVSGKKDLCYYYFTP